MADKEYRSEVRRIIEDSHRLARQRISDIEYLLTLWLQALGTMIPFEYLRQAEAKAYQIRGNTDFPLHPSQVLYAYELLKKEMPENKRAGGDVCPMRSWHLEGYADTRPHIRSLGRNSESIIIPCPTKQCQKLETESTEDFLTEMKIFKIAQIFHFCQTLKCWFLPLIEIEGNPITNALEMLEPPKEQTELSRLQDVMRGQMRTFFDAESYADQQGAYAEWKENRRRELLMMAGGEAENK